MLENLDLTLSMIKKTTNSRSGALPGSIEQIGLPGICATPTGDHGV